MSKIEPKLRKHSVLLICHAYPPVLGGSEIEAQRVAAGLIARGHWVTVLCSGGDPMPRTHRWTDPMGVPVRIYGMSGSRIRRDRLFAAAVAWILLAERSRYEVVYFLMQGLHLATGLPVVAALGKPIVMKISGSNVVTWMRQSWMGRLELRWLRKWARRIMILNDGMAKEALDAGIDAKQLLWMPNPVDVEQFSPAAPEQRASLRASEAISNATAVIIYVGRLAPEKDLGRLLEALGMLAARGRDASLVLVGDGPERESLAKKTAELNLADRVRFTGRLPMSAVVEWLRRSDVFALVSEFEGFPCSLVEAMAVGLPAVVSDIPGNTQLIEAGVDGWIAQQGNAADIADALGRLIGDPDARRQMGEVARKKVVGRYSLEKVLERYETLF